MGKGVAAGIAVKGLLVTAREENMPQEIKTINLGGVNCFLVKTGDGHVLIDTGLPTKRTDIEKELESAGCKPGNLKLIVLTHGDFDHTGNVAYLRKKFGTKIARQLLGRIVNRRNVRVD